MPAAAELSDAMVSALEADVTIPEYVLAYMDQAAGQQRNELSDPSDGPPPGGDRLDAGDEMDASEQVYEGEAALVSANAESGDEDVFGEEDARQPPGFDRTGANVHSCSPGQHIRTAR